MSIPTRRLRVATAFIVGGMVGVGVGAGLLGYARSLTDMLPTLLFKTQTTGDWNTSIFERSVDYSAAGGIVLAVGGIATLLGVGLLLWDPAWLNGGHYAALWVAPSPKGLAIGGHF